MPWFFTICILSVSSVDEVLVQMQVVLLSFGLFNDAASKYGSRLRLRSRRSFNDASSAA
jgi:hypothetical protein